MINGYISAVVTPFKNGKLDIKSFEKYMSYIVNSGVSGMVVCGSTGESLSLSMGEKVELVKVASRINNGKIKLPTCKCVSCTKSRITADFLFLRGRIIILLYI